MKNLGLMPVRGITPIDVDPLRKCPTFSQVELQLWWGRQDSNLRPTGYEPAALPLSYDPSSISLFGSPIIVGWSSNFKRSLYLQCSSPSLLGGKMPKANGLHS